MRERLPQIGESHLWRIVDSVPEGGVIVEWGSGFSTKYWLDNSKAAEVYAIEHDRFWARRVCEICENSERLNMVLCPNDEHAEYSEETLFGFEEYALAEDVPIDRADIIIIDGFVRGPCIATAAMRAKQGALLYLHDSDSKSYVWGRKHIEAHPSWSSVGVWPPLPEDSVCAEMRAWTRID